jgi:hypothetical protein
MYIYVYAVYTYAVYTLCIYTLLYDRCSPMLLHTALALSQPDPPIAQISAPACLPPRLPCACCARTSPHTRCAPPQALHPVRAAGAGRRLCRRAGHAARLVPADAWRRPRSHGPGDVHLRRRAEPHDREPCNGVPRALKGSWRACGCSPNGCPGCKLYDRQLGRQDSAGGFGPKPPILEEHLVRTRTCSRMSSLPFR